jgi:hypothetical protein
MSNIGKLFFETNEDRQSLGLSRQGLPIMEIDK